MSVLMDITKAEIFTKKFEIEEMIKISNKNQNQKLQKDKKTKTNLETSSFITEVQKI